MTAVARAVAQAHRGADVTEREARDRAATTAGVLRVRVLAAIVAAGDRGLTSLEAWRVVAPDGTPGQYSISPRITELKDLQLVEKRGARRDTPSAPRRLVWVATDVGRADAGS